MPNCLISNEVLKMDAYFGLKITSHDSTSTSNYSYTDVLFSKIVAILDVSIILVGIHIIQIRKEPRSYVNGPWPLFV